MNNKKNPYENNSYLKKDEEVLKEVLFFEKFKIKQNENTSKENENEDEYLLDEK